MHTCQTAARALEKMNEGRGLGVLGGAGDRELGWSGKACWQLAFKQRLRGEMGEECGHRGRASLQRQGPRGRSAAGALEEQWEGESRAEQLGEGGDSTGPHGAESGGPCRSWQGLRLSL